MSVVRLNISLPEGVLKELNEEVEARQRSRFIAEALSVRLQQIRNEKLAQEYLEAAEEARRENLELEGVLMG